MPNPTTLAPPTVPVAESGGLIKITNLTKIITVTFPIWPGSVSEDAYQLMLNGKKVGPIYTISSPCPEQGSTLTLALEVDKYLQEDGTYLIGYNTLSFPGLNETMSPTTTVVIDRYRPGAGLLAPMIFPTKPCASSLIGSVPGYAGIAAGDVIQTRCNNVDGPSHTVTADEVDQITRIAFPWDFLESLEASIVKIDYVITDRAGNTSLTSQPAWITFQV